MAKRKPARFSATKAVKANARERVGQPKPSRILPDKPRTGRKAKHKPRLDEISQAGGIDMAKAVGFGGVFLKARDPKALGSWYAEHLGIPTRTGDRWPLTDRNRWG